MPIRSAANIIGGERFLITFAVTLAIGERNAPARSTEQTPQGTHSIVDVGPPPFML